jgi:hypothetical protein
MIKNNILSNRPTSIISYLRKKFPAEGWKAVRAGFDWTYENTAGEKAWWCSALAPRYDGDDSFVSQFHIYRKIGAIRIYFD